jgi:hypothetical protein
MDRTNADGLCSGKAGPELYIGSDSMKKEICMIFENDIKDMGARRKERAVPEKPKTV